MYVEVARSPHGKMMENSTVLTNLNSVAERYSRRSASTRLSSPRLSTLTRSRAPCRLTAGRLYPFDFALSSKQKDRERHPPCPAVQAKRSGQPHEPCGQHVPDGAGYFNYLRHLVRHYGLEDLVRFEVNARFDRFDRLLGLKRRSKVYAHPLPGEPLGYRLSRQ